MKNEKKMPDHEPEVWEDYEWYPWDCDFGVTEDELGGEDEA